jgi:hypothetical protein
MQYCLLNAVKTIADYYKKRIKHMSKKLNLNFIITITIFIIMFSAAAYLTTLAVAPTLTTLSNAFLVILIFSGSAFGVEVHCKPIERRTEDITIQKCSIEIGE